MDVRRVTKRGLLRAATALLLVGFVLGGLAQLRLETTLSSFLPADDPVVKQLGDVARSFGGDPIVVLIEGQSAGELLDEQHLIPLLGLEGRLSQLPGAATVYGPGTVLNQIAGHTQDLLAELSGRRDAIRASQGEAALREFDARYGSLIVQGLPAGLPTLRNPQFVESVVYNADGTPNPQWQFVVPDADSVAILVRPRQGLNEQAAHALVRSVQAAVNGASLDARRVTVTGVPVVATGLSEQIKREIPLLGGLAIVAIGACFVLVPWAPLRRRLLPVATTLIAVGATVAVFGWLDRAVSLGVVAFLSVLLGIGSYYPIYLAHRTQCRVVVAVVAATSASFATLTLSPLPFVQDLGMTLSLGVLLAAGIGAAALRNLPAPKPSAQIPAESPNGQPNSSRAGRFAALAGAVTIAATGWLALPSMPIEGSFHRFAGGLPELADAERAEATLGSSGELAIVLRGENVLSPEAIAWAQRAHGGVIARNGEEARSVISPPRLLPFLGANPSASQIAAGVRLLPPYLTSAVFRSDHRVALLSFGVELDDLGRLHALRNDIERHLPEPPPGYHAQITGLPMAAVRGNELVSDDRLLSNTAGIVAAGVVLALGLRRRSDAARAVFAAAIAAGAGLAGLGLLGIPLSPITVVFGSLTAAVACEFTVVMAESRRHGNRVLRRSVVLAASASALGYAVLTASQLPAIREFGLLLASSALLSLASAWLITWATAARLEPATSHSPQPDNTLVKVGSP